MNDKEHIVMWLVGFIFLLILSIYLAPVLVEGAMLTGIKIGEKLSTNEVKE